MMKRMATSLALALAALSGGGDMAIAEQGTPPRAAAPAGPQRDAAALAGSIRAYGPMPPFQALGTVTLTGARQTQSDELTRVIVARWQGRYSNDQRAQLVIATIAWFRTRAAHDPNADLSVYAARVAAVDAQLLQDWRARTPLALVAATPRDDALLQLAIVFLDPLWEGVAFRPGQPQQALDRLQATPPELVEQLARVTGRTENPFVAAYALIATDLLYRNGSLQPERVTAALPAVAEAFAGAGGTR